MTQTKNKKGAHKLIGLMILSLFVISGCNSQAGLSDVSLETIKELNQTYGLNLHELSPDDSGLNKTLLQAGLLESEKKEIHPGLIVTLKKETNASDPYFFLLEPDQLLSEKIRSNPP